MSKGEESTFPKSTRDHFVPRAYLRAWSDPSHAGKVHVYRKRNEKHALQLIEKVCVERKGDLNKYFSDPSLLRAFLRFYEPKWPQARDSIVAGEIDPNAYFVAAGLIAYMLTCGPTNRRNSKSGLEASLDALRPMFAKHSKYSEKNTSKSRFNLTSALLDPGQVQIVVDPEFPRALNIRGLVPTQYRIFAGKWALLDARHYRSLITSDNPVSRFFPPQAGGLAQLYFPISPSHVLKIIPDIKQYKAENLNRIPDFGGVIEGRLRKNGIDMLNSLTAASAEDALIACRNFEWIAKLNKQYRKYRLETRDQIIPVDKGYLHIFSIRPFDVETGEVWQPPGFDDA